MRPHWFALVALVAASTPTLGDPQEPMVIALDWVEGTSGPAVAGLGHQASASWPVWIDACHRRIWADLLYEPAEASVTLDGNGVAVPYAFRVALEVGNTTLERTLTTPGFSQSLGETPEWGAATLTLTLERGALVDWSLRLRAWEVPEEPLCVPSVLVNEVEANPSGADAGNEWVELYNPGSFDVDVGGWTIASAHGVANNLTLPGGLVISRGGFWSVTFGAQFLDNVNETVQLRSSDGTLHDETPVASDERDDGRSWQRVPDGAHDWAFTASTRDAPNTA